jgi:hypothetical protein
MRPWFLSCTEGACPEVVISVGACSPRDSGLVGVLGVGAPPGVLVEYGFICPDAAVHRSIINAIIITFHFIKEHLCKLLTLLM